MTQPRWKAPSSVRQAAVNCRYSLPAWDEASYRAHKDADHGAAASDALHCVGWSVDAIRHDLEITTEPLMHDPLFPMGGFRPWEPWPAPFAADRFLEILTLLSPDRAEAAAPASEPGTA